MARPVSPDIDNDEFEELRRQFAPQELVNDFGDKFELVKTRKNPRYNPHVSGSVSYAGKTRFGIENIDRVYARLSPRPLNTFKARTGSRSKSS